jgi:hypothetical protein
MEQKKNNNFANYDAVKLNLGVWFSPSIFKEKASLSVNYTRNYLILDFSRHGQDGNSVKITKKLTLDNAVLFGDLIKTLRSQRINEYLSGKEYSEIQANSMYINSLFYDKNAREFKTTGRVELGTWNYNGTNFVIILASEGDKTVTVALTNPSLSKVVGQNTEGLRIDKRDVPFYRLDMEINKALTKSFEYAGFDKVYQIVKYYGEALCKKLGVETFTKNDNNNGGGKSFTPFKKFWGNKNNSETDVQQMKQVTVEGGSSESNEGGVDINFF